MLVGFLTASHASMKCWIISYWTFALAVKSKGEVFLGEQLIIVIVRESKIMSVGGSLVLIIQASM